MRKSIQLTTKATSRKIPLSRGELRSVTKSTVGWSGDVTTDVSSVTDILSTDRKVRVPRKSDIGIIDRKSPLKAGGVLYKGSVGPFFRSGSMG